MRGQGRRGREAKAAARGGPGCWLLAALLLCATLLGGGCADPTVQYHRQFEYLRRTGNEALAERDFELARKQLLEASKLVGIAAATDLERLDALTGLTRACRELGRLDEALEHANVAAQALARYRLERGGISGGVFRVGAPYLLERGRLDVARGDFDAADAWLADFVRVRGDDGGDSRESAEAQMLLGELRLARGILDQSPELFRASLDQARSFGQSDRTLLGLALFRVAESKLRAGRRASAAALVSEARPDGRVAPALLPSWLFLRGRIDAEQGAREPAAKRFEDGLARLTEEGHPVRVDVAAPARAIVLAGMLYASKGRAAEGLAHIETALAVAERASPLHRMQAGRRAVEAGRAFLQAGAGREALQAMERGRAAIAASVSGRPHDALVTAQYEIVDALASLGLHARTQSACSWLVGATEGLSERARSIHPRRLLACGRASAQAGRVDAARQALGRALILCEEDRSAPILKIELLLRMAALAHGEGREAEESKLFDRVLPFVLPGVYEALEQLLVEAYASHGRFQPSSAAARLGHAAARNYLYAVEAPQLQALAEKLGGSPGPASR